MLAMGRGYVLAGALAILSSATLFAQVDPTEAPMQQTQREQQQPGTHTGPQQQQLPQDSSAVSGMVGQHMKDKIFLRKAAEGGLAEVSLGQLAADKGSAEEIKSFGSKMVTDHTLLNDEMKPIADSIGVRLPKTMNKADQAEFDRLSGLSGDEFDREYVSIMIRDHRKDLHEFHDEASQTNDPSLKEAVMKGEGVIRQHTHMIFKIAKDKGISVPNGPPPPAPPPAQ